MPFTPLPGPDVEWQIADPKFTALPGAMAMYGTYEGGAYRIEVPVDWNGELVVYAHGYRGNSEQTKLAVENPPIRRHFIQNGFAWAASSYRSNGYVPGIGAQDSLILKDLFADLVGQPKRTYIYGQSMGGHAAMITAEFVPGAYDGYFTECGAIGGIETFDYFVSVATAAEYITGLELDGAELSTFDLPEALTWLTSELRPILGSPGYLSAEGRQLMSVVSHLSGGPRPFFVEGLSDSSFPFFYLLLSIAAGSPPLLPDVEFDRNIESLVKAMGNRDTVYEIDSTLGLDAAELNRGVERFEPDLAYRARSGEYPELAPFTGGIQQPVMQIKTTGDLFVPISMEQEYLELAEAAGTTELLVQRAIRAPGHCTFSMSERTRAFDDLVRWVRESIRPDGDDLSDDLSDVGLQFTDPLRSGDPGTLSLS
ncbi:MAG: alpha/beta hydrolase family protein [Dehalococcoidia bacterium]